MNFTYGKKIRVIYKTIWTDQKIVKGCTLGGWKTKEHDELGRP